MHFFDSNYLTKYIPLAIFLQVKDQLNLRGNDNDFCNLDQSFYQYFKENMNESGLGIPNSLFDIQNSAIPNYFIHKS